MAANKTVETDADVAAFLAGVSDPVQRGDADAIITLMSAASGHPPKMWGPSIIGFGRYHYRYDSGREGDMCRIGLSPRKGQTVLYIVDGFPGHANLMAKLGKHKIGKACLYIKKLADVDTDILRQLVDASLAEMDRRYPA
jgi:Domain of unknown function (DU1801)